MHFLEAKALESNVRQLKKRKKKEQLVRDVVSMNGDYQMKLSSDEKLPFERPKIAAS